MPDDVWGLLMLAAIRPGPVPIGWLAWYFRTGLGGGLRLSQVPGLSPGERDCAKRVRDWVRSKTLSKNPLKVMKSLAAVRRREMLAEMRADWRQSDPPAPHLAVDCQQ
jgi:hypothetical protein